MKRTLTNLKRTVAILVIFCLMFSLIPASAFAAGASDISGHWAQVKIQSWMDKGLIKGYPDGTFKPDQNVTRAELMTLANRAFGYSAVVPITYTDVKAGSWYAPEVAKAKAAGYISGYPDGTMKPENPITREETATIIARLQHLNPDVNAAGKYSDASSISSWSKGQVGAVTSAKIMQGYPDGSFMPQGLMTRAEVVVASDNALHYTAPVANIAVRAITVTPTTMALTAGGATGAITATVGPSNATNKIVTWSSSNAAVATVAGGVVTPVAAGAAVITATTVQGSFTATCTVTVTAPVVSGGSAPADLLAVGVTGFVAPVTGASPIAVGALTADATTYTKTSLTWAPADNPYLAATAYTATVVLTSAAGYKFPVGGIAAPTANGGGTVSAGTTAGGDVSGNTLTFTVQFPATAPTPVTAIAAISGVAKVGVELTAGALTPSGAAATASYQWQRADTSGGTYGDISGATTNKYTLVTGDTGKFIKVVATGTVNYSGTQTSGATTVVTDALAQVAQPTWSGDTINWVDVANETTYDVQLYKGGVALGTVVNVAAGTTTYDFATMILAAASGTYTVTVTAKGNGLPYTDGAPSIASADNTVINTAAIAGVTAPVNGATPTATITATTEYTATISWNGSPATFAGGTVYTATITLTPKTGYTLTGVAEDFFTVAGTTSDTNPAGSGVVTAVFPATAATISALALDTLVTAPVTGVAPNTTAIDATQYTGTIAWFESDGTTPVTGNFAASTVYVGKVTLVAKPGFTLTGVVSNSFTYTGATSVANAANAGAVAITFPATASSDATITGGALEGVALAGDFAGGAGIGASSELTVTVFGGEANDIFGLTKGNANSVVRYVVGLGTPANDDAYTFTYGSGTTINTTSNTIIWLLVTAQDGTTKLYYKITATAASSDATLNTTSTVKGATPIVTGTGNATVAGATGGSVTITAAQAADISNAGSYITLFVPTNVGATVSKVVKYATGGDTTGFEGATAFVPTAAITTADFFIVKVTAQDGTTILYYKVIVTVQAQSGSPAFTGGEPATFGTQLTVGAGSLTTTTHLTYTWYRSDDTAFGGDTEVTTGLTYTPIAADMAKYLIVLVTSTDATGTGAVATAAVVAKAAAPAAPTESITGTVPAAATSINLAALANSATGLEAAVAINGTDYAAYAVLTVSGTGTATISGLGSVTTSTKVRIRVKETATTLAGTGKEITVTAAPLKIGDHYQGGIVAYILQPGDLRYSDTVQRGLIAATNDQSTGIAWAVSSFESTPVYGTSDLIGYGSANTALIIAQNGTGSTYAAGLCDNYTNTDYGTGVYSDWYLPSLDELTQLYLYKTVIGGFNIDSGSASAYWSSSNVSAPNANYAWGKGFNNGSPVVSSKSLTYHVRAVRSFPSSDASIEAGTLGGMTLTDLPREGAGNIGSSAYISVVVAAGSRALELTKGNANSVIEWVLVHRTNDVAPSPQPANDAAYTGTYTSGSTNITVAVGDAIWLLVTAEDGTKRYYWIDVTVATSPLASFTPVTLTQTGDVANSNVQYANAPAVKAALPATVEVTLVNASVVNVPVTWTDTDTYNAATAGVYTFTATWGTMPAGANNDNSLPVPTVEVTVAAGVLLVTSITVSNTGSATAVFNNETLQMSATVSPTNATDSSVTWSVATLAGGAATIDASGMLTGTSLGTVTVTATNAASGVIGTKVITVVAPIAIAAATIAIAAPAIAAPAIGGTPAATIAEGTGYTGTISWTSPASGNFVAGTPAATVVLTAGSGYTFTGMAATGAVTIAGSTSATYAVSGTGGKILTITVGYAELVAPLTTPTLNEMVANAGLATGAGNYFVASAAGADNTKTKLTFTYGAVGGTLEYVIVAQGAASTTGTWADAPATTVATAELAATATGDLYVRIKAVAGVSNASAEQKALDALTVGAAPTVGQSYGGGKVAYIFVDGDPGYVAGQTHGLIAAAADQSTSTGIIWAISAYQSTAVTGTDTSIGSGSVNTDKIIAQNVGGGSNYAAGLARAYNVGGYNDWYLPSRDELNKLYLSKSLGVSGFADAGYWSSSQSSIGDAWSQYFNSGSPSNDSKALTLHVRAVRAF